MFYAASLYTYNKVKVLIIKNPVAPYINCTTLKLVCTIIYTVQSVMVQAAVCTSTTRLGTDY